MAEKTRYSDAELEEFRAIILEKLEKAKKDYDLLRSGVTNSDGNDVADTSPTFKVLEEGAATLSKEEAGRLAQRQMKFIQNLQAALIRIENKTYGICRVPIWGGQEFVFFRPIFNLADSAICVGVFLLLIFYRHTLSASLSKEEK